MPESKPLFIEEAADYLRVSVRTVGRYVKNGELKAYKHAGRGRLLFDPAELARFEQESREIHVAYVPKDVAYRCQSKARTVTKRQAVAQGPRYPQRRNADV